MIISFLKHREPHRLFGPVFALLSVRRFGMNKMQKVIIDKFLGVAGKRTFSDYAEMTGIERTRIFRIFNGQEMKISEYEKLNLYVAKYSHNESVDNDFFDRIHDVMSPDLQKRWQIEVKRKHDLKKLLKSA